MKRKLFLNEDDNMVVPAQPAPAPAPQAPAAPEQAPTAEVLSASNLINQMIKGEWDAIDLYNSVAITLEQMPGNEFAIETIRDIVKEEYVHVGQLEKALQFMNEQANKIKEGEQEAEVDKTAAPDTNAPVPTPQQAGAVGMEVIIK